MINKKIRSIITLLLIVALMIPLVATTVSAEYENTYSNTGNMRNDIIGVALTQVGYSEGANNYTKYGVWYGQPNSPWCGMFVSWCASQAGVPTSVLKRTGVANPSNFGLSYQSGSDYIPQKGDLFFKTNFSHVGFVYYTEGEYFYTVEGNTSTTSSEGTSVMIRKRKISEFYFSSPNYADSTCDHNYDTNVESEHPHREFKVCSKCKNKSYTGKKIANESCKACQQESCSHTFTPWEKKNDSKHIRICSKCDFEEVKNHNYVVGKVVKEATCTENGQQQMICSDCNAESTKDLKATGVHKYTDYSYIDENEHQIVCDECNEQTTSKHTLSSKWKHDNIYHWTSCEDCGGRICHQEHVFKDGCVSPCEICGFKITNGHKQADTVACDAEHHWTYCIKCDEIIEKTQHNYQSECDEVCDDCGYQRVLTAAHNDTYIADDSGHWYQCNDCNRKTEILPHCADQNAKEWETLSCMHCGYELRATIRHEHQFDNIQYDKTSHWGNCQCGKEMEKEVHSWDFQTGACSVCGITNNGPKHQSFLDFLLALWHRIWNR